MRLFGAVIAGVLSTFLVVAGTPACHAEEATVQSFEVPALQAGRMLLRAGRLHDAHTILEQVRPADEDERIERLFLLGLVEVRLGLLREAARRFETILASRPELTRVRLELARVYYVLGRDDKARFHFESSLADELPSSVESAVEGFLRGIDTRKRWSVSLSGAVLPETNPVKRTGNQEVLIGGIPFQLSEDARESSGVGFLVSAGGSFSPKIAENWRAVLAVSSAAKFYRRSTWNDISLQGETGIARLFDRGTASGGIRVGQRWLGGNPYSREIGPWARGRIHLTVASRLDVDLSVGRTDYRRQSDQNGWRFSARPSLRYGLDAGTTISTDLDFEVVHARERRHASRLAGLGITVSRAFEDGLSISTGVSAHVRRYSAPDPLFQKSRSDRQIRLSINILHRALQIEGFAPFFGYSFEWNKSNIPINTYRNQGAIIGVSTTF